MSGPSRVPFSVLRQLPVFEHVTVQDLLKRKGFPGFPQPVEGAVWHRRHVVAWLRQHAARRADAWT